jgi:tetratricopeptide (TPR) repeat protein
MTPERWKRAGELFHAALAEPAGRRRQWVENTCAGDPEMAAEVLSLLGSDAEAGPGYFERRMEPAVASLLSAARDEAPARAGPYRLVRELGRGGMGTVYLGERDDEAYQTQVAIKLVRRGMDTDLILNRFYRERQTLARLQHPNIARLLDGGTTAEGHPYIVMEYVEGEKITTYCRERGLSIPARVRLFLDVCRAVEYAHRNFVVHRDLKPGNILVDATGAVKLLDFGICKLLPTPLESGDETMEAGPPLLTPDYASPEQIRGDRITVASDVYSLTAVLYELLTGAKPHRIEEYTLRGIERGICDGEIRVPSAACGIAGDARQLRGDLDTILLHGLQKEAERRYESVEQFAEDLRRYMAHEPIRARGDSAIYRLRKFVRRRRGALVAAVAVLMTMAVGVAASMRSARIANENVRLVRQLSNTFVYDVYDAVGDLPGATRARQIIVRTGLKYLEDLARGARGDAELQRELAAAYRRMGDVQGNVMGANLGNTADALASYGRALALLDEVARLQGEDRETARERIEIYRRIGGVREYAGDAAAALASYHDAEVISERLLAGYPDDRNVAWRLAELYIRSSHVRRRRAEYEDARKGYARAAELLSGKWSPNDPNGFVSRTVAAAYSGLAQCDAYLGRLRESLASHREVLRQREAAARAEPNSISVQRELMFAYSHAGDVLGNPNLPNLGDAAGAAEVYGRMIEVARRIHEADPADLRAKSDYGIALARFAAVLPPERSTTRIRLLRQAIALTRDVLRVNPDNASTRSDLALQLNFLGDALDLAGDRDGARATFREALSLIEPKLRSGTAAVVTASLQLCRKLGMLLAAGGQRSEALALGRRALEIADPAGPVMPGRPPEFQRSAAARSAGAMGHIYLAAGDAAEARSWLEKARGQYQAMEGRAGYTDTHRRELRATEKALEGLR